MEIEKMRLEDIKPYENNAKEHPREQIEQIKNSIRDFGNNDPIAVDEDGVVIEGHGRLMALKELGYAEADVIVLKGLTEDQKAAYRLAHNNLTMNSGFDLQALEAELKRIEGLDMADYGFDMGELESELSKMEDEGAEAQEDGFDVEAALEDQGEPMVRPGEIWRLGDHFLMCGDSTKKEDVERLMSAIAEGGGLH